MRENKSGCFFSEHSVDICTHVYAKNNGIFIHVHKPQYVIKSFVVLSNAHYSSTVGIIKPALESAVLLFAYANYSVIHLSPISIVRQWPEWPSSTIVLAAMSSHSAAGPPRPQVSQMFPLP